MKIADSLIAEITDYATNLFKPIFNEHITSSKYKSFEMFLNETIQEILDELNSLVEVTNETVYVYINRRLSTKKRWVSKELKSKSLFYNDIEVVAKTFYERQIKKDSEKFYNSYGFHTFEELRSSIVNELHEWSKDHEQHVSQFKYLETKTSIQIIKGMANDIRYIMYKEIYQKCPKGITSAISSLPLSMSSLPIDYTNQAKIQNTEAVKVEQGEYYLNKYYIDDHTILESRLNAEILKQGVLDSVLKTLNSTDINVFLYCMSLRDDTFYNTREIIVDIGDIVKNIFSSRSSKNYTAVKESLYRMQHLNSGVLDQSLRGFTVTIFDNVQILPSEEGDKETATITVNKDIVGQYVKEQTVSQYRDIINNFQLDTSKVAIYRIQAERIKASLNTKDEYPILEVNYNFFRGILYFSNKKKRVNIQTIQKMLDEIVANDIAIKSYERKGDIFTLEFYPLSPKEKRELVSEQNAKEIVNSSDYFLLQ
ncbi:hypothetical protein QTG56_23540 (plasmid) [Rossellomorea sp. AcN35-11]|nr:hypothetical protein [Rossellomorea aquimaris]WJV32338.1 hypothetical protein QTG56_23540 [Rossellomorea sp. AcN35-11]